MLILEESNLSFALLKVEVGEILDFGPTQIGHRRMIPITGGQVSGEIGSGRILSGADWQWVHKDGTISLDAHYVIRMDSGELIEVESRGTRFTSPEGEVIFRTSLRFSSNFDRPELNQRMFSAVGQRLERLVVLEVTPAT